MYVVLNGRYVKSGQARVSVLDNGFLYGDGVYDTLRTYNGKVWQAEEHVERFRKSAEKLRIKLSFSNKKIIQLIEGLAKRNGFRETRIRLTLTRGVNGFDFTGSKNPTLLIQAVELINPPKSIYKNGVNVITVKMERVEPVAKTTSLLPLILASQKMKSERAFEALYVGCDGFVREGSISNLFILKRGVLMTPKNKILMGTTRALVIKVAKSVGLKVKIEDFKVSALKKADEVFICNTTKNIVPVRKVDKNVIGPPGPVTKKLMKALNEYIQKKVC